MKDAGLQCRCEAVDGGITLICVDACAYCNPTQSVCGINSAQAFYDNETGKRNAIGGVFKYEKALKDIVSCKGASGIKPCVSCINFIARRSADDSDYLVHVTSSDPTKFVPQTAATLEQMATDLAAK